MVGKTVLPGGKQKPESWNVEEQRTALRRALEIINTEDGPEELREILQAELDRLQAAERALCERLGISQNMPELHRWALIGYHLAAKEGEFVRQRRRRAPKKARSQAQDLLDLVELGHKMFPGVKDKEIIRAMKELPNKHPTIERLVRATKDSLGKRVSEARSRKNTRAFNRD